MIEVAVVGAGGYVGKAICTALEARGDVHLIPVTRGNYEVARSTPVDVLVNCAMPSGRFWAQNNPADDFRETVQKTADLLYKWPHAKLVQVSSLSARCQPHTVYGRHKAAAEALCRPDRDLLVRLGPMYSSDLAKGVLIDMLRGGTVYVGGSSRYGFASRDFSAGWIAHNLDRRFGIVEVGGRNALALEEVARRCGFAVQFDGSVDHQEISDPEPDFPDAAGVFEFLAGARPPVGA